MSYEKGPQLTGLRLEDADFGDARLHAPNFARVKITDGWFYNANISGDIEGLQLNGVMVGPLVRAELERRDPDRVKLRANDPDGLIDAWAMIEDKWKGTVDRARELGEPELSERVDDEWSFVETHRHLVMATDSWLRRMIKGMDRPYHPWGIAGSWLADPSSWGLDPEANPSLEEVLAARRERMDEVKEAITALTPDELKRKCPPPDAPGHPTDPHTVLECLHVILEEEWEHHGYAVRDLATLEATSR